jgi:hypothetical protein
MSGKKHSSFFIQRLFASAGLMRRQAAERNFGTSHRKYLFLTLCLKHPGSYIQDPITSPFTLGEIGALGYKP